jgi:hypothetical protein
MQILELGPYGFNGNARFFRNLFGAPIPIGVAHQKQKYFELLDGVDGILNEFFEFG